MLSKHVGSDSLNAYKLAWSVHANQIGPQEQDQLNKVKVSGTFTDHVIDEITQEILVHAAYAGMAYMATSHYPKIRMVGGIALRLLPVLAIAGIAYSIYKLLD